MDARRFRRSRLLPLLGASALVLAACQAPDGEAAVRAEDDAGAAAAVAATDAIALRVTLELEDLVDGRNQAQHDYRKTVDICEQAGVPVKALAPDQVERLGTGRIELLLDAERRLARETRWLAVAPDGPEELCLFELEEAVSERYADSGTMGWSDAGDDGGWQEVRASADDLRRHAVDVEEAARTARQLGWEELGTSSVSGQPCKRWRNHREEACMWSGGEEAGYASDPPGYADCFTASFERFEAAIPLQVEPVGGSGCRIGVASMTVTGGSLPTADVVPVTRGRK